MNTSHKRTARYAQHRPAPGSVLIWWRRCCRTAARRGSGAPTLSRLVHCPAPCSLTRQQASLPTRHTSRIARHAPRLLLALLVWWFTPILARAGDVSSAFEEANRLYEQANLTEAAAAYEKILQSGQATSALYFNLGNALFKSGQIGRAILNYRLAQLL